MGRTARDGGIRSLIIAMLGLAITAPALCAAQSTRRGIGPAPVGPEFLGLRLLLSREAIEAKLGVELGCSPPSHDGAILCVATVVDQAVARVEVVFNPEWGPGTAAITFLFKPVFANPRAAHVELVEKIQAKLGQPVKKAQRATSSGEFHVWTWTSRQWRASYSYEVPANGRGVESPTDFTMRSMEYDRWSKLPPDQKTRNAAGPSKS